MKVAGIVSEYNPFHNGHEFLINETYQDGATHIVAVMSGNYVQRGETAIVSKWARTKQALSCGVDLVIELPLPWVLSSAENFGKGAVSLFDALGCVDEISFGCECGDINILQSAANAILSPKIIPYLTSYLNSGLSFPSARETAVREVFGSEIADVLKNPNNILAVEYIKALINLKSSITPFAVQRIGAEHDSEDFSQEFLSSSQIRKLIYSGNYDKAFRYMPLQSSEILQEEISEQKAPCDYSFLERAALCRLRQLTVSDFSDLSDIGEGLENRIYSAVKKSASLEEVYSYAKTKRYTHSRIRRIILSAFLGIKSDDSAGNPPYIKVLGFNKQGGEILKAAKHTAKLPIITRSSDILSLDGRANRVFRLECLSTDIFAMAFPKPQPCGLEMTSGIIKL